MANTGNVKIIANDGAFTTHLEQAGSKLVVVDFHATWCGPCKRIAPIYVQYSLKYPNAVFLKVDVDQCKNTASKYDITAMPTFLFLKAKVKIDSVRGAGPNVLLEKIKEHYDNQAGGGAGEVDDEEVKGHFDLTSLFSTKECNCLNESDDHVFLNAFKKDASYLESDCDEQLILTISFNQPVKVHSLKFEAPSDGKGPKDVKVFVNQPNQMGFDQAEGMEPVQKFELTPENLSNGELINLRFVKFQNVSNLVLFMMNNQGDEETTVLKYLKVIGSPLDATNMKDFKRIAGKAGESH